ncbi:MAG: hypothetical protein LBL65_03625 [Campylobacteraceae bacterium]|jgi:hypothetical protein|nr:hypothetical protein [Campylobacteraceae bacterium]
MGNMLKILKKLYDSKKALTSLDFGDQMSNPNQYFCELLTLDLISERTITKNGKTFKIRFIPQEKRAKAKNYICELEQRSHNKKTVDMSRIEASTHTNGKTNKAGQSLKTLFDCLFGDTRKH